ncbi:6,7-dimethyl-8-ribityllumazine synthase, partial [human gut metagenome]
MKVGIVAARFNEIIVNKLLGGAVDGLVRHGVEEENITAAWVPEHLRFRLQHRRWHSQENMMQLSALELSSV